MPSLKRKIKKPFKKTTSKRKIPLEIEKKFILRRLPIELLNERKHIILFITQYYFNIDGTWERFRVATNKVTGKTRYIHTIKEPVSPGVCKEDEHAIMRDKFKEKFNLYKNSCLVIEKTRFVIKYKGLKFEIDLYHNLNFVTLEVELPKINYHIEFPPELAEEIIYEVTGIKQFSNQNLAFQYNKKYVLHFKKHK